MSPSLKLFYLTEVTAYQLFLSNMQETSKHCILNYKNKSGHACKHPNIIKNDKSFTVFFLTQLYRLLYMHETHNSGVVQLFVGEVDSHKVVKELITTVCDS